MLCLGRVYDVSMPCIHGVVLMHIFRSRWYVLLSSCSCVLQSKAARHPGRTPIKLQVRPMAHGNVLHLIYRCVVGGTTIRML